MESGETNQVVKTGRHPKGQFQCKNFIKRGGSLIRCERMATDEKTGLCSTCKTNRPEFHERKRRYRKRRRLNSNTVSPIQLENTSDVQSIPVPSSIAPIQRQGTVYQTSTPTPFLSSVPVAIPSSVPVSIPSPLVSVPTTNVHLISRLLFWMVSKSTPHLCIHRVLQSLSGQRQSMD